MKRQVHVIISGRVQGVWFRASTREKAEELGLTGWVRNTSEGNVEAVFTGEEDRVQAMLTWCHQGPPLSKVDHVTIENQQPQEAYTDFRITH